MNNSNRLRIAIQKGGRLSKDCQDLLKQLGVKLNLREQRLIAHSTNMPIDVLRVRDDDIPGLVMDGVCDLGIVGENVLVEVQAERMRQGVPSEVASTSGTHCWPHHVLHKVGRDSRTCIREANPRVLVRT